MQTIWSVVRNDICLKNHLITCTEIKSSVHQLASYRGNKIPYSTKYSRGQNFHGYHNPLSLSMNVFPQIVCRAMQPYKGDVITSKLFSKMLPISDVTVKVLSVNYTLYYMVNLLLFVTGFAKRGLIADPNLESLNLTCEFGTTLKLGSNIPLTLHYCLM